MRIVRWWWPGTDPRHRSYEALTREGNPGEDRIGSNEKAQMHTPVIVDGRNVFDPTQCEEAGFVVRKLGRGS